MFFSKYSVRDGKDCLTHMAALPGVPVKFEGICDFASHMPNIFSWNLLTYQCGSNMISGIQLSSNRDVLDIIAVNVPCVVSG